MCVNRFGQAKSYKGYNAELLLDLEAGEIVGRVLDIDDVVSFVSPDAAGVQSAFEEAVDDYLEWCAEDGREPSKPYSGKLSLRLPPDLHRQAAAEARRRGESLNGYINQTLAAALAPGHAPGQAPVRGRPVDGAIVPKRLAAALVDG